MISQPVKTFFVVVVVCVVVVVFHRVIRVIVVLFVVQVLIREGKACENVFVQLRKSSINEHKNLLIPL